MAEKLIKTSLDSILSEFSSHDSTVNNCTVPTSSVTSRLVPLRSSFTLANLSKITNPNEYQSLFLDNFSSKQSSATSRWQSDAGNLDQQSSWPATYLMNDFRTNKNIASPSITDVLISSMSHLSTSSSSTTSLNNIGNSKATNQRSSRSAMTNSSDQLTISNENFPSVSSFLPFPTPSSNRQILSTIDNDLQQVPHSGRFMSSPSTSISPTYGTGPIIQPQVVHSTGRANSMPCWSGCLPMQLEPMTMRQKQLIEQFSQKVFLGGIPAELFEAELLLVLGKFGKCNIKWPKNDGINHNKPGFCHVVFRESRSVCELLNHCAREQRSPVSYFLHIHMTIPSPSTGLPMRTDRLKPIQVVPWNMRDNVYVMQQVDMSKNESAFKDWSRTIFVSPLHGKMTAFSLATILSNIFGPVSMAQVNTDKYGYPTGTGTILFSDSHSYMRAVAAGAIDIKCDCFHKLLDIDPFLRENEPCAFCPALADLFCRNFHCLRSFCKQCWINKHGTKPLADHQPATRRQQPLHHI